MQNIEWEFVHGCWIRNIGYVWPQKDLHQEKE